MLQVLFALNFAFSGLLSTRLLLFKKSHRRNAGEEQSKINHIALIDAANVFLCDFLPTFSNYVNQYPFFSFKVGVFPALDFEKEKRPDECCGYDDSYIAKLNASVRNMFSLLALFK
nr:protein C18B10.5 [imported] - Caenorhabditis elegans [Caenorhabditis elegans]